MASHQQGSSDIERTSVLFIDDDPNVTMSLRMLFEPEFETFTASTVAEGVGAYRQIHPAAVVLDLRLPDKSGLEALREIRAIDSNAKIVVLTAYATQPNVEASLRLGAMDCLLKPFDAMQLRERITEIATHAHPHRYLPSQQRPQAPDLAPLTANPELLTSASSTFLHDVNNPLSAILALSEYLSERVKDAELDRSELAETLHLINENALYISSLVEHWRAFAEPASLQAQPCTVESVVDLALRLASGKAEENGVALRVASIPREWKVRAGRFALARVLVNLFVNAIEACREHGREIELAASKDAGVVNIWIRDNGRGIDLEPIEKVFEPRVTTKNDGMGLGLFICRTIIESFGGTITVRRRETGGTAFRISLRSV